MAEARFSTSFRVTLATVVRKYRAFSSRFRILLFLMALSHCCRMARISSPSRKCGGNCDSEPIQHSFVSIPGCRRRHGFDRILRPAYSWKDAARRNHLHKHCSRCRRQVRGIPLIRTILLFIKFHTAAPQYRSSASQIGWAQSHWFDRR